jgi:hypothetical protein
VPEQVCSYGGQAANASFLVALLPLNGSLSARFNVSAAWQWFRSVEGLPYGYVRATQSQTGWRLTGAP